MSWLHQHRWQVRGAHHMVRTTYLAALEKAPECPITEVLEVCESCGEPRTITLEGHWTMEQLTIYSPKGDQAILKTLGVKL